MRKVRPLLIDSDVLAELLSLDKKEVREYLDRIKNVECIFTTVTDDGKLLIDFPEEDSPAVEFADRLAAVWQKDYERSLRHASGE